MYDGTSYMYWASSPQSFFVQTMSESNKVRVYFPGNQDQRKAFARIVKKEPKYASKNPFRGVAKLGSQEYAFALDYVPAKSDAEPAKPDGEKAKPDTKKRRIQFAERQAQGCDCQGHYSFGGSCQTPGL